MGRGAVAALMGFADAQPEHCPDEWKRAVRHPFVEAVADGSLPPETFDVWIQQDHHFVRGLAGVVRDLIAIAPEADRRGLRSGLEALGPELALFGEHARERGITLVVDRDPVCVGYLAYLNGCVQRGYPQGLAAYHGVELAYLEAWASVRERIGLAGPYRDWVENWTSEGFAEFVDWLGGRLDRISVELSHPERDDLRDIFREIVRFEVAFWDACWTGSP